MNNTGPSPQVGDASSDQHLSRTSAQRPSNTGTASATATITIAQPSEGNASDEVLRLTLRGSNSVTWDEAVIDNEGLGRKSSKRCCIFHKQRAFGESSSDSDDENNSDGSSSSGGPRSAKPKPIARKKEGKLEPKKVPDYQRFHA